jgi:hypothetical protein
MDVNAGSMANCKSPHHRVREKLMRSRGLIHLAHRRSSSRLGDMRNAAGNAVAERRRSGYSVAEKIMPGGWWSEMDSNQRYLWPYCLRCAVRGARTGAF